MSSDVRSLSFKVTCTHDWQRVVCSSYALHLSVAVCVRLSRAAYCPAHISYHAHCSDCRVYVCCVLSCVAYAVPSRVYMLYTLERARMQFSDDRQQLIARLQQLADSRPWRYNQHTGVLVYFLFAFAVSFTFHARHCSEMSTALYRLACLNCKQHCSLVFHARSCSLIASLTPACSVLCYVSHAVTCVQV